MAKIQDDDWMLLLTSVVDMMEAEGNLLRKEANNLARSVGTGLNLTDIKCEHAPIPSAKRIATEMWFRIKNREADRLIENWRLSNG